MNAVGRAAMEMVQEVRRQFREIPGIMEGTGKPEYDKCVAISTEASLKQMLLPGILTIGFPLVIAFVPMIFGMDNLSIAEMLGGYMAGVTVSGVLWAIFQNNAGGAWDNAKKSFEAGVEIDGEMTYKGSEAHKAAVTGDTVGDPFKDTSGPSMNILIKLTCLIGLVLAPILGGHDVHGADTSSTENVWVDAEGNVAGGEKEVTINMTTEGDLTVATIETISMVNGNKEKNVQKMKGTEAEVKAKLAEFEGTDGLAKNDLEMTGEGLQKDVQVEMAENEDGTVKAVVTTTTTENGETSTSEETIEGTMEEVKAKLDALENVDANVKSKKIIKKIIEEVEETKS
jgi:K(+)-stimulated pyrophosphate-energized sodium pump